MKLFFSRQFIAFLCTGGIAACVNFGSRIIYNQWLSFSNAVILAYITGMVTAFVLAKLFVFRRSIHAIHKSALFFLFVNMLAIIQTWATSIVLMYYVLPSIGVDKYTRELAHAVGVAIPIFTSYIGHKNWSFKS